MVMYCPLCHTESNSSVEPGWWDCLQCRGRFKEPAALPTAVEEQARYEEHNNDVHDPRYRAFAQSLVDRVVANYSAEDIGLDFGAGIAPVVSVMLEEQGYTITQYDPLFHNYPQRLAERYAYIVACEVIEHFHTPAKEFAMLASMLLPGGSMLIKTHCYDDSIHFDNWYYRRDPTHVFLYRSETIEWIARTYGFTTLHCDPRVIYWRKEEV